MSHVLTIQAAFLSSRHSNNNNSIIKVYRNRETLKISSPQLGPRVV